MKNNIRLIFLTVVIVVLQFCTYSCIRSLYLPMIGLDTNGSSAYVDGTDMSAAAELTESAVIGAVSFVTSVGYGIFITILAVVLSFVLKAVTLSKNDVIAPPSYTWSLYVFLGMTVFSTLLNIIMTKGSLIAESLIYNGIWALLLFLIYMLPLRAHIWKPGYGSNDGAEPGTDDLL